MVYSEGIPPGQSAVADYNLTYEEVKIIDPEIEKIILEKDYEKFEIK